MITSIQNPHVKHWVHLRQNRDYREEHQSVLIVGTKLVQEVCPEHNTKRIIAIDDSWIPENLKSHEIILVSERVMEKVTGLQHPEGIAAEVELPKAVNLQGKKWILALDAVSDPGNLGTLLRTALALGWEGVFILENSCDPYNDKAIRAAKGATFRIPVQLGKWNELKNFITLQRPLFVADMGGESVSKINAAKGAILVLSNEGQGPSEHILNESKKISIPMPGKMESLNVAVAGAILMYVLNPGKL